jgi:hypothetical protein
MRVLFSFFEAMCDWIFSDSIAFFQELNHF